MPRNIYLTKTSVLASILLCVFFFATPFEEVAADSKNGRQTIIGTLVEKTATTVAGNLAEKVVAEKMAEKAVNNSALPLDKQAITQAMANNINRATPTVLDEFTILEYATSGPGPLVTYHHRLQHSARTDIDIPSFHAEMESNITESLCFTPELLAILKEDITLAYTYNSATGSYVTTVFVGKENCNG